MKSLQRFAGATLAGLMMALASAPAARADSMLFGLDFGQTDLLDDVGDFWQDVTDGVSIRLGVGTSVAPRFEGSDSYKVRVMPKFAIRYENLIYLKNNRLRVFAIHSEKFVAGAQAKYEFGRDEDASPDLMGLGNVGDSLEMGGFIEWQPGWAVIGVEFGQDVAGGHNGFMASAYAGSRLPLGAGWSLAGGVQATWASENYMERNYGVSAEQSVASGLPEFDAKSGLKHVAGRIGLRFDRWKHWRFDSYVAYARLMSDAANNPLVELRGSPNQFIWAISGQYQF